MSDDEDEDAFSRTLTVTFPHGVEVKISENFFDAGVAGVLWCGAMRLMHVLTHPRSFLPIDYCKGKRTVELGAGTGIISVVASKLGAAHVTVTDQSVALENMELNLRINIDSAVFGERCSVLELEWGTLEHRMALQPPYDAIFVAECVYPWDDAHIVIQSLLDTIHFLSDENTDVWFCGINTPKKGEQQHGVSSTLDLFLQQAPQLFDCHLMCVDPREDGSSTVNDSSDEKSAQSKGRDLFPSPSFESGLFPSPLAHHQCRGVWLLKKKSKLQGMENAPGHSSSASLDNSKQANSNPQPFGKVPLLVLR